MFLMVPFLGSKCILSAFISIYIGSVCYVQRKVVNDVLSTRFFYQLFYNHDALLMSTEITIKGNIALQRSGTK